MQGDPENEPMSGPQWGRTHFVIPDTQVRPGDPIDHLDWIGRYILERRPQVCVMLGDWYDMPSLSSYDRGRASFEGRRYKDDIRAGDHAWRVLDRPVDDYNRKRREQKKAPWEPDEKWFIMGNHDQRADRPAEENASLEGVMGSHDFDTRGWTMVPYLQPKNIDGLTYCHFFCNPNTGKGINGRADTKLKNIGFPFVQGHLPGKEVAERALPDGVTKQRCIVAGSCYLANLEYRGPQAQQEWRGILVLHNVRNGYFDLMEVPLHYLCWKYEGVPLEDFKPRIFAGREG